jgi:hypothetical protein
VFYLNSKIISPQCRRDFGQLQFINYLLLPNVAAPLLRDNNSLRSPCSIYFWEIVQFILIRVDSGAAALFVLFRLKSNYFSTHKCSFLQWFNFQIQTLSTTEVGQWRQHSGTTLVLSSQGQGFDSSSSC